MSNAFDATRLRTVHLVPLTAYRTSGEANVEAQAEHTARMYDAGIRVFMPAAGTSEFHSLSADEVVDLVQATVDGAGSDALVFAPVGLQIGHALDVGQGSLEAGATGVMFMPFEHPYLSDSGAADYYRTVIDRLECPSLIYKNAPVPADNLLLELAADPHVVGVKYAWNQMHEFRTTVLADRHGIEWICGSAERFAPYYMLAGSTGYTSGAGNICPRLTLAMHAALAAGDYPKGMRFHSLILPVEDYRGRAGDSYNVSMLKHALTLLGHDFGRPRPPQRQLTDDERVEIEALIQPILNAEREKSIR